MRSSTTATMSIMIVLAFMVSSLAIAGGASASESNQMWNVDVNKLDSSLYDYGTVDDCSPAFDPQTHVADADESLAPAAGVDDDIAAGEADDEVSPDDVEECTDLLYGYVLPAVGEVPPIDDSDASDAPDSPLNPVEPVETPTVPTLVPIIQPVSVPDESADNSAVGNTTDGESSANAGINPIVAVAIATFAVIAVAIFAVVRYH